MREKWDAMVGQNQRLHRENTALRRDLDEARLERAEWMGRAERSAGEVIDRARREARKDALPREVEALRALLVRQQDQLIEAQRMNEALSREAVDRAGTLAPVKGAVA